MSKKKDNKEHLNIIDELNRVLTQIGWAVAIPDAKYVDHLIIGKQKTLENVVSELSGDYDIMVKETQ